MRGCRRGSPRPRAPLRPRTGPLVASPSRFLLVGRTNPPLAHRISRPGGVKAPYLALRPRAVRGGGWRGRGAPAGNGAGSIKPELALRRWKDRQHGDATRQRHPRTVVLIEVDVVG